MISYQIRSDIMCQIGSDMIRSGVGWVIITFKLGAFILWEGQAGDGDGS